MRFWKHFFLPLLLFFIVERFCHFQTGGFEVTKIRSSPVANSHQWSLPLPSLEEQLRLEQILNQRFKFFQFGGQAYAFLSEDGKVVLKVFKQHHLRPPTWMKYLPLPRKWKTVSYRYFKRKARKGPRFFTSCYTAYTRLRDRTGLIYLHLGSSSHLQGQVTLIDKLNIAHTLDLDTLDFALQEYAELPYAHFKRLRSEGDLTAAKASIDSLLELIVQRCKRGVRDNDPCIRRNCGFLGNTAIDIDLGSYLVDPTVKKSFIMKTELYRHTHKFGEWLERSYSEVYPYFVEQLARRLSVDSNISI